MMKWWRKSKSQPPMSPRSVHLSSAQKAPTFQYSSNRSSSERGYDRGGAERQLSKQQKIKKRLTRIPYLIGSLCLTLGLVYLSTLSSNPQLIISGNQKLIRDKDAYRQVATELLKAEPANRTKLSIDGQEVAQKLQTSFPELKAVDVSTPLFRHRPVVEIVVSSPAIAFVSGKQTYVLDERGVVLFDIEKVTNHSVNIAKLPRVIDQTSLSVELNKPALSQSHVQFIEEIVRQTQAKDLEISTIELVGKGGELSVSFSGLAYKAKFSLYEDGRKSVGAFLAAKEQIERDGTRPAAYIDVRIPTRAYIK